MHQINAKIRAARLSVATATGLALLKLFTGLSTGSMAVLASAVDSLLDIFMSTVNYLAIRQAEQPADENHPYGHGKYETVATLIQALIICLSGLWIIVESVQRLRQGAQPSHLEGGIAVLLISSAASWGITRHLQKVARATDSSALKAESLHFRMDIYTNLALLAGLVLINWLNIAWLDGVLSILVALYIFYEAVHLLRHGMADVLDEQLPTTIRTQIEELIVGHHPDILGYHDLRTRRAGSQKIMSFHLTVCKHLSVEESHAIADSLEQKILKRILRSDVTIHIDPCQREHCPGKDRCQFRIPEGK